MTRPLRALMIDLDGTLVDPKTGIVGSVRHALDRLGCAPPAAASLDWVIGPPLRQSLASLLDGRADPEAALALYRQRYAEQGLFEARVYPGIIDALESLGASLRLILCTSKPRVFALRVLEHFGLQRHFSAVYGAELDGRFDDKADLIERLLDEERLATDEVRMVGDRRHDVLGAARNGVATLGVLWGYGDAAELTTAGAAALCRQPADLATDCLRNWSHPRS